MRDHRRDVETGLHHHRHLVPGLVHLAAVDALQRQHVEDDRGEVDRHLPGLDPEQGDAAAVRHRRQQAAQGGRLARHLERDVESLRHPELGLDRVEPYGGRVDGGRRPHPQRQLAPVGVRVGDDDVTGARVADDRDGHAADRAGAGDEHVLAEHRERERRVDGVAERVEDRGDVLVDPGPVVPDVRHRQRDQLGEGARPLHAEPDRVRAQVPPPGHAVAAAAADDVALAADDVAGMEVAHVRADLDDLAHELVPDHERHRDRLLRPGIPRVDVEVGAADPGLAHPDQDVVDPDLRLGDILEPEPRLGSRFDERSHESSSSRRPAGRPGRT